jgi:hypothetical protein
MKNKISKSLVLSTALAFAYLSCSAPEESLYPIVASDIEPHLIALSSDDFMGRMPFTEGETKTIANLENEFNSMGLEPGNGDSYFQEVPMVSILTTPAPQMTVQSEKGKMVLEGLKY